MKCPSCRFDNPDHTRFCGNCAAPLDPEVTLSHTPTFQELYRELKPGTRIAEKYEILEKLGEGGMGIVYKALDTRLQREVALKFLSPHLTRDREARERFMHEARAASALDFTNICTIHEIHETHDGWLFIAMAYYQGETLKSRIRRGALKFVDAMEIARQIAEGLSRAHGKGIIHRDIKSANIIITNDEIVKIVDFGLAKLSGTTQITKAGATMGTVAYMSPEQAKGDAVDQRTDIWSLGVVLYEMMAGALPFRGEREESIIYSILNVDPVPIASLLPDIPVALERIITRCLEKNPRVRYQHVREVLADLRDAYKALDLKPGWRLSVGDRLRRRRWLTSTLLWVSGVVVVSGILGLLLFFPSSGIPFEERDWIVIADLDNQTGDDVFDRSLNTALTVNIQQSSYVNVFPAARIKETLQRMEKSDQEVLNAELAAEVAQREGIKAVVACRIDQVGEVYNLTARIIDPVSQVTLKTEASQAVGKDRVLEALDDLAGKIRKDLGESLRDIAQQRVMLPKATTSSLEALKLFTEGESAWGNRHDNEAVALFKKALELDPEFAMAHAQLGAIYYWGGNRVEGEKHFTQVLELMDRLTDRERLLIQAWVPAYRGNRDEATIKYRVYLRKYPDDAQVWHNLAHNYLMLNRFDEAIEAFNHHLEIYPSSASAFINLATCYTASGRFEPALENYRKGFEINPQFLKVKNLNSEYGFTLVAVGEIEKAEEVFRKLLEGDDSLKATAYRHLALLSMYQGKLSQAGEQLKEAALLNNNMKYRLSEYRDRLFLVAVYRNRGMEQAAVRELAAAVGISRLETLGPWWLQLAARAYARIGMLAEAAELYARAAEQFKEENREDQAVMNILQGEIALAKGNQAEAVDRLEKAYTLRTDNYVLECVANAYREIGDVDKAIEKYEQIIAKIDLGWEAQDAWIQAHYQLGKAYQEKNDPARARQWYERFLALWKDADPDLPALQDARARIATLN